MSNKPNQLNSTKVSASEIQLEELNNNNDDNFIEILDDNSIHSNTEPISSSSKFFSKFGNCFVSLFKNGSPVFVIGPDFKYYILVNILLFIFFIVYSIFILNPSSYIILINYFLFFSLISIYFLLFIKNPGIPSLNNSTPSFKSNKSLVNNENNSFILCSICSLNHYSNSNTQHCFECGVCIERYDHHCPWIGKCVGKGNSLLFQVFLIILLVYFFFCLINFLVIGF